MCYYQVCVPWYTPTGQALLPVALPCSAGTSVARDYKGSRSHPCSEKNEVCSRDLPLNDPVVGITADGVIDPHLQALAYNISQQNLHTEATQGQMPASKPNLKPNIENDYSDSLNDTEILGLAVDRSQHIQSNKQLRDANINRDVQGLTRQNSHEQNNRKGRIYRGNGQGSDQKRTNKNQWPNKRDHQTQANRPEQRKTNTNSTRLNIQEERSIQDQTNQNGDPRGVVNNNGQRESIRNSQSHRMISTKENNIAQNPSEPMKSLINMETNIHIVKVNGKSNINVKTHSERGETRRKTVPGQATHLSHYQNRAANIPLPSENHSNPTTDSRKQIISSGL